MTFKYVYVNYGLNNMQHFTDVFNTTHYSQSDIILSLDTIKYVSYLLRSFYFDPTIPIYNSTSTSGVFLSSITGISDMMELMIMVKFLLIQGYLRKHGLSGSWLREQFYEQFKWRYL